jgi:hypothetical protein
MAKDSIINKVEYFPGVVGYTGLIPDSVFYAQKISELANSNRLSWMPMTTGRGNVNVASIIPELRRGSVIGLNGVGKDSEVASALSTLKTAADNAINLCLRDYEKSYGYFDLEGEGWALLKYEVGDFFKVHTDASRAYPRQVSTVYYINDDYTGGEIFFPYINVEVKPKKDEFLVFPSTNLFSHYAKEVVSGTKYSMPNWFS